MIKLWAEVVDSLKTQHREYFTMNIYTIWNDAELELVTTDLNEAKLKHEEVLIGTTNPGHPLVEVWNNGKIIDTYDYLYGWHDGKFDVPVVELRTELLKEVQKDDSLEELCAFCMALDFELLEESLIFGGKEMYDKIDYIINVIDLGHETKRYQELIRQRRLERGLIKNEINIELDNEVSRLLARLGVADDNEKRSDITNKALLNYFTNNPNLLEVMK